MPVLAPHMMSQAEFVNLASISLYAATIVLTGVGVFVAILAIVGYNRITELAEKKAAKVAEIKAAEVAEKKAVEVAEKETYRVLGPKNSVNLDD